jgi:hypothetical protein
MSQDKKLNHIGRLSEQYSNKPALRSLLQLIPGWGSADVLLQHRADEIHADRLRTFFNELGEGKHELTEELIQSEDFLHCFFMTTRAALNTRQRDKIKMFARLLSASLTPGSYSSTDEYEEYLGILDDLSCREIKILTMLDNYESRFTKSSRENEIQRAHLFWELFTDELENNIGIHKDELIGVLTRLARTGCYEILIGGYTDTGGTGVGKLTHTYFRLKNLIAAKNLA